MIHILRKNGHKQCKLFNVSFVLTRLEPDRQEAAYTTFPPRSLRGWIEYTHYLLKTAENNMNTSVRNNMLHTFELNLLQYNYVTHFLNKDTFCHVFWFSVWIQIFQFSLVILEKI